MKRRNFIATTGLTLMGARNLLGQTPGGVEFSIKKRSQSIKTNVLVVGGGPAGIGAAIGAAKTGVNTLLIENCGFFGGVASWGVGMCMNQMRPDGKPGHGGVHSVSNGQTFVEYHGMHNSQQYNHNGYASSYGWY